MNDLIDSKRDRDIIEAGGFYCAACLVGKPLDDISPDPRYCQGCYEVLIKEAEILTERGFTRRPSWMPLKPKIKPEKEKIVVGDVSRIMSTVKDKKSEVDIIHPPVGKVTCEKRGPKHRDLPEDLIKQWGNEGLGSKAIMAKLAEEHKIAISYKTIQRILSGQRVLI